MIPPIDPNKKGRLRKIVLRRDRLEDLIWQPRLERAYPGGIAAEDALGKGINLKIRELHAANLAEDLIRGQSERRRCQALLSPPKKRAAEKFSGAWFKFCRT